MQRYLCDNIFRSSLYLKILRQKSGMAQTPYRFAVSSYLYSKLSGINDCAKVLKCFQYLSEFQKSNATKVIFKSDIFNVPKAFKTLVFAL